MAGPFPDSVPARPPWPGYSARDTLVLPLPDFGLQRLPPVLEVDGVVLGRKREAHLTLLDRDAAARVRTACSEVSVREVFRDQDWGVVVTGERWLLRKPLAAGGMAHSVVAMVHAPGLAAFRSALARRCGVSLPEAPPHVTLYVAGKPTGIGVPDIDAFERLRVRQLDAADSPQSP